MRITAIRVLLSVGSLLIVAGIGQVFLQMTRPQLVASSPPNPIAQSVGISTNTKSR